MLVVAIELVGGSLGALQCPRSVHPVALHVVIRPKNASNLDESRRSVGRFELKSTVSRSSGRISLEFGTVKPRVQIPGPRPVFVFSIVISRFTQGAPSHGRVTAVSQILEKFGADSLQIPSIRSCHQLARSPVKSRRSS